MPYRVTIEIHNPDRAPLPFDNMPKAIVRSDINTLAQDVADIVLTFKAGNNPDYRRFYTPSHRQCVAAIHKRGDDLAEFFWREAQRYDGKSVVLLVSGNR